VGDDDERAGENVGAFHPTSVLDGLRDVQPARQDRSAWRVVASDCVSGVPASAIRGPVWRLPAHPCRPAFPP
jgi:hypothetical protein